MWGNQNGFVRLPLGFNHHQIGAQQKTRETKQGEHHVDSFDSQIHIII